MNRSILFAVAALATSAALVAVNAKPFTYNSSRKRRSLNPAPAPRWCRTMGPAIRPTCADPATGSEVQKDFWEARSKKMIGSMAPIDEKTCQDRRVPDRDLLAGGLCPLLRP